MSQFGYLDFGLVSKDDLKVAIKKFQDRAGLNVTGLIIAFKRLFVLSSHFTGELDKDTLQVMSMPRCGVRDNFESGSSSRSKRYALPGSRWKARTLTYRISKYPKKLNRDDVDKEIAKALDLWSDYTDLTFTAKNSSSVHIDIRFEIGDHGDKHPFDGPGGIAAHAFYPVNGGNAHFDEAETWTINSDQGINLFQIAGKL